MATKRRAEGSIPAVEKLYRRNQEDYANCGGFDVDDDAEEEHRKKIADAAQKKRDQLAACIEKPDICLECEKTLGLSWLWDTFNHPVCDLCKDLKNKHKVISRTEAKKKYVLKDEDLDYRKPILRYNSKKNPHNPRYGDMKLYLVSQVERRAVEVHGSLEDVETTKKVRQEKRDEAVNKRFEKRIKEIKKQLRPDVVVSDAAIHEHDYAPEQRKPGLDGVFFQECKSCGYKNEYEKM